MLSALRRYNGPRLWVTLFLTLLIFDRWTVYNTPLSGLDGSWIIAIHLVHQLGLLHGTEFVFTYGPLGWLLTRLPIAAPAWPIVLFDGLWLLNVAAVLWLATGPRLTLQRGLLLTLFIIIHKQCAGAEIPFSFYFFVLFYLAYYQRTGKPWALTIAVVLATLTFYLKANVGLVSLCSVVIYGLWPTGNNRTARLVAVGGLFLLVIISAYYLPVRLYSFLLAHWHLIDSYNDVMYDLLYRRALLMAALILGVSVGLLGFVCWRSWQRKNLAVFWGQNGLLLLLIALQVFVLFKEAFVRADAGHVGLFFKYGLLPFGLLVLFGHTPLLRRMALIPVVIIPLAAPLLVPYHWDIRVLYRWMPQWVAYCQDVVHPQLPELAPVASPWPDRWLRQLRGKRIDIMPDNISLLYAHQLQYAPRPVIQAYQVTDTYLDSLNAAYFLSNRAPDYVLLTIDAMDSRE